MTRDFSREAIAGLYAVTPDATDTRSLLAQVDAALSGGARVVQYRNKSADARVMMKQARALKTLCARHGVPLIVNDDVDLARAVEAAGVHVGAQDAALATARGILGPSKIIGVSCYNEIDRAREAARGGADYVAFGSFFPSPVKPAAVRAPIELLSQAKRDLALPVVAIGGVTIENAAFLVEAGADALAVISALFAAADVAIAARRFAALFATR